MRVYVLFLRGLRRKNAENEADWEIFLEGCGAQMSILWLYTVNIFLIIAVVCFQRKEPVGAMAWVLCFIVLPVLGPVIYLVFGLGLKHRTKKKYLEKANASLAFATNRQNAPEPEKYLHMIKYFENTAHSVFTDKNDVKVYTSAEKKYEDLLDDIKNAKETVNLLYFIIHNDEIGKKLLSLLADKAEEGVQVRFLYDGFGSIMTPYKTFRRLKNNPNGHVAAFFPLNIFSYSLINHRNHRKLAIIDGKIAYMGGMNIGDEYMGKKRPTPWRDTHMRIVGQAVSEVQRIFCLDWEFTTGEDIKNNSALFFKKPVPVGRSLPMQIVASGPDSTCEEIKCGMIKMLSHAKDYAFLQTPYFAPDVPFLDAIKTAAQSGVDVRVMIPSVPDKKYVYYTTMSYMDELLAAGVRVYLYPGFIHSKTLVCDDEVCTIGTTNIDTRSFLLHFEINAFMYSREESVRNRNIFLADQEKSYELTMEIYKKRGIPNIMKEGFFRLFAPIM